MALLHEVEAETLQITRFRKVGCRKSYAFAGLRTAPATHRARNTANTTFSCRMLQNTGFGTIPWGGGGGGGVSCFYSFGEPLKTWTYAMLMYSLPRHFYCIAEPHKRVSMTTFGSRLSTCY